MKNKATEKAKDLILKELMKLNVLEARYVVDFINAAIAQGSLCPVIEDSAVGVDAKSN